MSQPSAENRDFFEAKSFGEPTQGDLKSHFIPQVKAMLHTAPETGQLKDDLEGVLSYLNSDAHHNSEGRDLSFDKKSFSDTELKVAARHKREDQVLYLLYRYRFNHYPRNQITPEFPLLLAIEPTSICNLRCVMCFQADVSFSGDKERNGYMPFETFRRVIDEASENSLCAIVLASRGEPLLHKQIGEMISYAKKKGILDVKLNTNATCLTAEKTRELLDSGLDTLVFSVDSHVAEEYEHIRPPAKFSRVLNNIEQFNEIRSRDFPNACTRTRVSAVQLNLGQDVEEARKFWRGRADEFGHRWVIDRLNIYDYEAVERMRPCSLLWERLYVWHDGIINTCDEDYQSKMNLGRLGENGLTIKQAWHSPRMTKYRDLHGAGNKNSISPCDKCHGF